jgi:hypothetical protein
MFAVTASGPHLQLVMMAYQAAPLLNPMLNTTSLTTITSKVPIK